MVHDLTSNGDFGGYRGLNSFISRVVTDYRIIKDEFEITSPYDEIVLTGTYSDREHKRYILDYESGQKNMCDCCGLLIGTNKPWNFQKNKTLCPDCERFLEETHNSRENGELLEEVIDDSIAVRVVKPWDIIDFEQENIVDNVLLWD